MTSPPERFRTVGYVLVAFLVQIVGYAALLAVFPHSDVTPLVAEMRALPLVISSSVALFAVPAVLLALGLGTVLSTVLGVRPASFSAVLLADGDVFVFASAIVLAVGSVLVSRHIRR